MPFRESTRADSLSAFLDIMSQSHLAGTDRRTGCKLES
jgi:hypothetical protein